MTDEQIKQNADNYTESLMCENLHRTMYSSIDFIAGAHSRDEEIEELQNELESIRKGFYERGDKLKKLMLENNKLRNPWITDRDPEIKDSISDAVLLLIDGLFYRVSRLERRKDGSEFWWGVDVANGEEVTAWMPIPELKKEE